LQTIDHRLTSEYNSEGKHLLRGFLISTRPNQRNWSISKETIDDKVKQFIGKDFIVVPDILTTKPVDDHVYAEDYDQLLAVQKNAARGKIIDVFGPFPEADGHKYYDCEIEVTDNKVSEALAAGTLPLEVSPYIFPAKDGKPFNPKDLESRHEIADWIPANITLTKQGAFGWRAALSKQCFGEQGVCHSALAASSEEVAHSISSLLHSEGQTQQMSDASVQNLSGPTGAVNTVPTVDNAPIKSNTQNTPINSTQVSVEEFQKLQTELAAQTKINEKLVLRHKTDSLNKIFGSMSDETEKQKIIKKWIGADTDILADFHSDILNYVVPNLKVKEEKPVKNALAASEDCGCSKHKKEEDKTDFPLAGSARGVTSRLTREKSLTELLGGA